MNLQSLFQDFNPSKFIVYTSCLAFTVLFCLHLDGYIDWPIWAIFAPLWIWKLIATLGAIVGAIFWCRHPHYRIEADSYVQFKAMLISLSLHLILLMFELLACDRLSSGNHLWVLVFIPLVFGSVASVGACVWAVKHDRSFELEMFLAVNALQFVFLPLKLDGFVSWSWEVVFVPVWIVLCISVAGVLYSFIFCGILMRTPEVPAMQKRQAMNSALGNSITVLLILICQVLIADKLDGDLDKPFIVVAAPLILAFFVLILLSFSAKGGNKWWFGLRKNFSMFLLNACPCLQEYGNISYHTEEPPSDRERGEGSDRDSSASHLSGNVLIEFDKHHDKRSRSLQNKKLDLLKPVVPIVHIEMPD